MFRNVLTCVDSDDEECFRQEGSFTCGQIERMYMHWYLYRQYGELCTESEMEVTVSLRLNGNFLWGRSHAQLPTWTLVSHDNHVVFNSAKDHLPYFTFEFQDSIVMDLCLPKHVAYEFRYEDFYQPNANPVGSIIVMQDGVLLGHRDGNVGDSFVVSVPPLLPLTGKF